MRARKVDGPQAEIVSALRRAGCLVWIVNGSLDLVCQWRGALSLLEVKAPKERLRLTEEQAEMVQLGWIVHFVTNVTEAYEAVGVPPRMRL